MGEKQAGGAPFGGEVGKSLDSADQAYMTQQTNRALESAPTNQTSTWVNPDSQSQVALTPTRTYQRPNGTYCREYSQAITIKNQQQRTTGTACRQPDGSWQAAS
jgi:surface antigen